MSRDGATATRLRPSADEASRSAGWWVSRYGRNAVPSAALAVVTNTAPRISRFIRGEGCSWAGAVTVTGLRAGNPGTRGALAQTLKKTFAQRVHNRRAAAGEPERSDDEAREDRDDEDQDRDGAARPARGAWHWQRCE